MEEANEQQHVTGSYSAFSKDEHKTPVPVDARIEDPEGHVVFEKQGHTNSDFKFTAQKEGEHKLCFTAKDYHTAQSTRIRLSWRTGAEATDWQAVAQKDKLDSIHTELRRLEQVVHDIHLELQYIRRKEEQMRDINEATNSRVAWLSIGALIMCILLMAWQLWHLQKFLKRKKVL
ncbi:hypothetical protein N2152v2_007374 [Parachlorella kessleri]